MVIDLLTNYIVVIIEFILEFYVFFFLLTNKSKKIKANYKFLILGVFSVLIIAFSISAFYTFFGNTVWGRIITYILLFLIITIQLYLCYKESFSTILFCSSLTYVMQNLTYKIFLFVWCIIEKYSLYNIWGNYFDLCYRIFYYVFFALVVFITYKFYIKNIKKKIDDQEINIKMLYGSLIVLATTIILCSIEDVYFSFLSINGKENKFDNNVIYVLRQSGNLFSIISCAVLLLLFNKTLEEKKLQQEVEYLQYAVKQSELQYQISKDTIDMINIKCHDIKYKIQSVLSVDSSITSDTLNDLQETISIYDTKVETKNKLLDVLLTEKSLFCEQKGINFSCMADGSLMSFINDGDLYCLFGNIIDNALDAVINIKEKERRVINLIIKVKNNFIIIQEDNYFDGSLEYEKGLPLTTKSNKQYHGFGLKSISMIVDKYNGVLTVSTTKDIFHLNIMFNLPNAENVKDK